MKKITFTSALILFLLTGCSNLPNKDSQNNNNATIGHVKESVTIEFLCLTNSSYKSELERMIKEFEEIEPKVSVNLTNPTATGNYNVLEKTVISGFFKQDYPDIVQCYPDNVVQYIDRGYALNVDPYLNNETYGLKEEKSDYIATFLNEGANYSKQGTYSLPFCKSTELMYYNADKLLNLDLSAVDNSINDGQPLNAEYLDNLTWDELFDKLCPALKTYNQTHDLFVDDETSSIFTYDSDQNFFITLANQYNYGYTSIDNNGKGSIDFDNANMKQLVLKLKEAKDNKYLLTTGCLDGGRYVSSLFTSNHSLFTVSSTAGLSYNYDRNNPFTIGAAKLPKAPNKDYSSINQGPSVCLLDHFDENRSLASFLFWKYITNEKNSSSWAINTGYMGIRNSSYNSEEYKAALDVQGNTDLYAVAVANNLNKIGDVRDNTFNTAVFRGSSNARTNVGLLLTKCLTADDLASNIDSYFKESSDDAKSYLPK